MSFAMACDTCANPVDLYVRTEPLGSNAERQSFLLTCPSCGTLYEIFPLERTAPLPISKSMAEKLFPNAKLRT
jgi:hypothetical protein